MPNLSLLGSQYPLIQAPMAGAQDATMTIAVCKAGALGSLPAALLSAEQLATQLELITKQTQAPFNVNFFAHQMQSVSLKDKKRWQTLLTPYFTKHDIDPALIKEGALRLPFQEEQLEVIEQYRPKIISFHFGLPNANLLKKTKDTGAKILSTATSVSEALWLLEHGVDAIIAQGSEAGGHRGMFLEKTLHTQTGTFALIRNITKALNNKSVPIIAAGGIADHQSIQAALKLGASAVQVGTTYLLSHESKIGKLHKQAIRNAKQNPEKNQTAITNVFSGKPARGLVNQAMLELDFINANVMPFPYAATQIAALRQACEAQGKTDFTPLWCGQNPSACEEVSAYELTKELIKAF